MWWFTIVGCGGSGFDDPGCLHSNLDDWCFHEGSGPVVVEGATCPTPNEEPSYRCGDYDVHSVGGGFTSESLFFDHASGELVAVQYTTDVNTYCGGFVYWYGKRVQDCEPECSYNPNDETLPACE